MAAEAAAEMVGWGAAEAMVEVAREAEETASEEPSGVAVEAAADWAAGWAAADWVAEGKGAAAAG